MRSRSLLLGVATALLGVGAALLVAACAAPTVSRPARPGVGFGQPIGEADLAAWNIDIRTSDGLGLPPGRGTAAEDRKSTRLNSSHLVISYAVFCLKKKKKVER